MLLRKKEYCILIKKEYSNPIQQIYAKAIDEKFFFITLGDNKNNILNQTARNAPYANRIIENLGDA